MGLRITHACARNRRPRPVTDCDIQVMLLIFGVLVFEAWLWREDLCSTLLTFTELDLQVSYLIRGAAV